MIEINTFLKQLLSLPGLSAYEAPVRDTIAEIWRPLVDELTVSRIGSLHGLKYGFSDEPRLRIMIAVHMDAIGMMVSGIAEGGFIRITPIGGVDPRILPGQLVTVHGQQNLPGVVCQPPGRLLPGKFNDKPVAMKFLYVDTGLQEEEIRRLVRTGDIISFSQPPIEMTGDTIAGHSVDNRASVAALSLCLQELKNIRHAWDVWAVATVQEEVTMAGARTSPFEIDPHLAIAVDVTFAKGPGVQDYRGFSLDKGPTIGLGPVIHPALHKEFKNIAKKIDIPHQIEVMPSRSGTDADGMQTVAKGIPSMVLSIPIRYMHTPVEMVALNDITRASRLLVEFIAHLEADFFKTIAWDD